MKKYFLSCSGGKDSVFLFYFLLQHKQQYRLDGVVHFKLEIDYPFIANVMNKIKKKCEEENILYLEYEPRKSYKELYDKYGFPTRLARWCNSYYKLDCKKQFQDEYPDAIQYIGYCYDEANRYQKRNNKREIYPLVEYHILESEILDWARENEMFNEYYRFNTRCGCMYCPMAKLTNLAYLAKFYPDNYEQYIKMMHETEEKFFRTHGRAFSVRSSNPDYDAEYTDHIVKTKYLPKLEKIIEERTHD